jgi:hypothetical protein
MVLGVLITQGTIVAILETVPPPPFPRPTIIASHPKKLCSLDALVFHNCCTPGSSEEPRNMAPYVELVEYTPDYVQRQVFFGIRVIFH